MRAGDGQAAAGALALRVMFVQPLQLEAADARLPRRQPGLQGLQQAPGGEQQAVGRVGMKRQLDALLEGLGQADPGVGLGFEPVGQVQGIEQACAKAPAQPAARQGAHRAQVAAAQALQRRRVLGHGAQAGQGQDVQAGLQIAGVQMAS